MYEFQCDGQTLYCQERWYTNRAGRVVTPKRNLVTITNRYDLVLAQYLDLDVYQAAAAYVVKYTRS